MLQTILKRLFAIGPLLFGVGFIAPVFAALVEVTGLALPFEIPPLYIGFAIGIIWGGIATKRGAWI